VDHGQGEKPPGVTGQLAAYVAGGRAVAGRQLSPRPPGGSPTARRPLELPAAPAGLTARPGPEPRDKPRQQGTCTCAGAYGCGAELFARHTRNFM
jgi:hypothetical protein